MVTEKKPKSTSAQKTTSPKKTAATKKSTSAKKTATKSKTTSKTPKAKATAAKKPKSTAKKTTSRKKVSTKALLLKKFDAPAPKNIFQVPPPGISAEEFTSPPFVAADDEAEVKRIRALLFKKFDLNAPATPKVTKEEIAPVITKRSDPVSTSLKWMVVGFVLLIALVVKVSVSNRGNYYLIPMGDGVEIRQGIFAPMGQEQLIALPGAELPEATQTVYTKQEVYIYIFHYYVKKADDLLEKPGRPDFENIKRYLNMAMPYGITDKLRKAAEARLNNIDQVILLYKADVSISKETLTNYEAALGYLKQAADLDTDGSKADLIKQKIDTVQAAKAKLEEAQEKAASEPAPSK